MNTVIMHDIEHIEVQFLKLYMEHTDSDKKVIKLRIVDENGQVTEINLFMTDSGTMNINQE